MKCLYALFVAGCAMPWLSSCASYQPQPLSASQNAQAIEARSLTDPRLHAFIDAARGEESSAETASSTAHVPTWDLATLTLAALYYHPNLDIARARWDQARAGIATAHQIPNPSLSFEDLSYGSPTHSPAEWTVAPVINFLIETAGKRRLRTRVAEALAETARSDLATTAWQVRGGVRDALLGLWAAHARVALLQQRLDLQDQLATLLEHRLAAGASSALDVARERTHRNQARLAVQDAERAREVARTELASTLGIPRTALDGVDFIFDALERPETINPDITDAELRRRALTSRSDVQSLLARYAAADSALALEVARQYPDLTLSPGYSFDSAQNRYLLLPALDLPIFNHNQGPIAESLARREEAAASFTAFQLEVVNAVDGAAADYQTATRAVATADALLQNERDHERRTLHSFQAGTIDRPTLLTAQLERLSAEQSSFDALVRQRQALGAVEDALQHPFFGPALPAISETNPRVASRAGS